jgi:hypothetical protein
MVTIVLLETSMKNMKIDLIFFGEGEGHSGV